MALNLLAFADEYGNNSFDFQKQGTHFIVACVVIESSKLELVEKQVEEFRKKNFQTGEIKSKNIGDNHSRRLNLLSQLSHIEFNVYSLVVDKEKLFGEGFKYKEVFYKYINGLLYKELYKAYPKLVLTVDEHGGNDFLKSFKKYVYKTHIRDLFDGAEFETQNSNQSVLIQLADLIAGTLSRCFDRSKDLSFKNKYLNILESKLINLDFFPRSIKEYVVEINEPTDLYDALIYEYSTNSAIDYIERKVIKKQSDIDQINCLKLLLLYQNAFGVNKYISSKELIRHLQIGREKPITQRQFRSLVIGKLRDEGVLIASKSKGDRTGYKLPTSSSDLIKFLQIGNGIILPMLSRIKICRDKIKLATNNGLDILDNKDLSEVKKLIEVL
jgi:hypothetical protein